LRFFTFSVTVTVAVAVAASVSEKFSVAGVDISVGPDITFEEAFGLVGDIWLLQLNLGDFVEVVSPVYLPAPVFKKTDVYGIVGAEKRASHAHQTVVVEAQIAVSIAIDVLCGTALETQVAPRAFVLINLVKKGIDIAPDVLGTGNHSRDYTGPEMVADAVGNIVAYFIDKNVQQLVVHAQHLFYQPLVEAEVDVVGHDKMVLVAHHYPVAAQLAHKVLGGGVVGPLGFAGILVDECLETFWELLVTDEFQKWPWGAVAVDGVAQTKQVVCGVVQPLVVKRVDFVCIDLITSLFHLGLEQAGQVAGIECPSVIEQQALHLLLFDVLVVEEAAEWS